MTSEQEDLEYPPETVVPFYDRPQVQKYSVPVGRGVPLGIERVSNPELGIAGAYGTWGECYDNVTLPNFIEHRLGRPFSDEERLNLSTIGFSNRHHISDLLDEENVELEIEVGARFLREAAVANGWDPGEVDAVMIGMSGPVSDDYIERIGAEAGIPESAIKVSVHKACDSSVGALHLALNPNLGSIAQFGRSMAEELFGKKVLIGGLEGLSRLLLRSRDLNALQLFGNGAGFIGVIPGKTMQFLVGKAFEAFDEKGVLAFRMNYPHSRKRVEGQSLVEVSQAGQNSIRVAGLMKEPAEEGQPVDMAGPMGMVKLFVRNGVQVVSDVYMAYHKLMRDLGTSQKSITTAIVHHANLKICNLITIQLEKEGIHLSMPWLLSEFGNVSAASNMIAFLRQLPGLKPGDHILFDGFGAGTYYDVLAVELEGQSP